MENRYSDELAPLNISAEDFFGQAVRSMYDNPGKSLPVVMCNPETGDRLGDFFMRLENRGSKIIIVAEGFSIPAIERGFRSGASSLWKQIQPGVYEIEV